MKKQLHIHRKCHSLRLYVVLWLNRKKFHASNEMAGVANFTGKFSLMIKSFYIKKVQIIEVIRPNARLNSIFCVRYLNRINRRCVCVCKNDFTRFLFQADHQVFLLLLWQNSFVSGGDPSSPRSSKLNPYIGLALGREESSKFQEQLRYSVELIPKGQEGSQENSVSPRQFLHKSKRFRIYRVKDPPNDVLE